MNYQEERQSRREILIADIIEQVRTAIREELTDATPSFARGGLDTIEATVISHTGIILDALSSDEMQSEGALLSYIANARCAATRLLRERRS